MTGLLPRSLAVLCALGIATILAACGSSAKKSSETTPTTPAAESPTTTSGLPNACPTEGCKIHIVSVKKAATGNELEIALDANYAPDVSRNHFHVYWDHFTSKQVSDDAEPRFNVTQGAWVPTADNPFTTTDAVSVTKREQSMKVCVTAGDRNHDVIDPTLFECRDVRDLVT